MSYRKKNIEETVDDIWSTHVPKAKKDDPESWKDINWKYVYGSSYNMSKGFLGYEPAVSQVAWNNRQEPKVYEAFTHIWNRKDLGAKLDRVGFMRPTKFIVDTSESSGMASKPEWETERNWVHWDQNPFIEPNFCRVQGLITLSDHTETSGGFHCIPGFTQFFHIWASQQPYKNLFDCLIDLPKADPNHKFVKKITMREGSLLIWDSRLPHGNFPNEGTKFRIVQYVTFFPSLASNHPDKPFQKRSLGFMPNIQLTELGKKIAGIIPYSPSEISNFPIAESRFNLEQWGY